MPIINRSQGLISSAQNPVPAYSRVVSCAMAVPPGPGAVYSVTGKVGQRVWLRSVRLWGWAFVPNPANQTLFRILTGTTDVNSAAEILTWHDIFPLAVTGFPNDVWAKADGVDRFEWSLLQLFTGEGRRFGFWAERGAIGMDEIIVSFEISEG